MYAVIFCGGKQHKVAEGEKLSVELINDAQTGSEIELDKVLLVSDGTNIKVGAPYVAGAKVTAKVLGAHGGEKVKIVKFRRRKHHQKVTGHRQWFTVRQRGTHFHAGANVGLAKDDSLFAKASGKVTFVTRGSKNRKFVEVVETQQ